MQGEEDGRTEEEFNFLSCVPALLDATNNKLPQKYF